jgi:glycosyltransferase involved in cell wall biosynthesis
LKIAILGTVGVPANYGGFETLVENLVKYHHNTSLSHELTVYCSSKNYPEKRPTFLSAQLRYVPLNANGVQSVLYDIVSLLLAGWNRSGVILLLGVSGAIALPLLRCFSSARIVTNIDGIEWRREKWQGVAKWFLRFSEKMAIRFSHEVISDNAAIAEYAKKTYGTGCPVIAYGGDQALRAEAEPVSEYSLPASYALAVCRIEPENNVDLILEAFSRQIKVPLVVVGNWNNSDYGRELRARYESISNLYLLDPIYQLGKLKSLRSAMSLYVHGHSAGGTNPSLVEAMHFGKPIVAFNCDFNRYTTESRAIYFDSSGSLLNVLENFDPIPADDVGRYMLEIAQRRYTWSIVATRYFDLLLGKVG